ncbi:MAG: Holliday junction resolvase RuvX [Acidimicrobiales bacterium]|nr:Holliday junction resolvase RuvX [Acidimicrobiales bacterium]
MRALGIDLGAKRIGVALSNSEGTVALPYEVVERTGDRERDHRRLAELVEETEAEVVVVGLPYSLDGRVGPAARRAVAEVRALERVLPVPVHTHDERMSTVSAHRSLAEAQMDSRARRKVVDKVAAAVILQAWLDGRRARAATQTNSEHEDAPR